ncbi:hypothetical protein [Fibrobacter succinogenes]|uniref:hypothetical protein n=1 Tax=Fibrobacter succinogenes TaxID=833 RepID=UPI001568C4A0|nr:hypothetical protein [Fibrobacter succinogenes]
MRNVKLAISLFCIAFYFASCGDDSASSSNFLTEPESNGSMSSETVISSSSSIEGVSSLEISSSSVLSSSSELLSSSAPDAKSSSSFTVSGIVIKNGDKKKTVQRFDADPKMTQSAGRFWLLMSGNLDKSETEALEKIGIHRLRCYSGSIHYLFEYSGYRSEYSYMDLCLMKADKDVEKMTIMSLVEEVYNTYDADESVADGIVYSSRGKETLVKRIDDDSLMTQVAGRFWIIKDYPMEKAERESLKGVGIDIVNCSALYTDNLDMNICFAKSEKDIEKVAIDSRIDGLYNTFSVDDTTKLEFDYTGAHWVVEDVSLEIVVGCWDDIPMDACKEIVKTCKGEDVALDRSIILGTATSETIDCLLSNKDVNSVEPLRYGAPL